MSPAPTSLKGKKYVDLSTEEMYRKNYSHLTDALLGTRPVIPPLRKSSRPVHEKPLADTPPNEPVKIVCVIEDEVTEPALDGTRGSALYSVPFKLNRVPSSLWSEVFIRAWNRPLYSTMHRPGIASVRGAKIILNGTTIEEVKRYHRNTLITCVDEANQKEEELLERKRREQELHLQQVEKHRKEVKDTLEDLSFD